MDLSNDIRASDSVSRQEVFTKIGLLTRQLHDALTELGYTDTLQGTVGQLPDAKSRLAYIARLTGEAAEKVLNRVDLAKTEHDHILGDMIAHGMEHNVHCDLLKAAHTHLCVEQARRKS